MPRTVPWCRPESDERFRTPWPSSVELRCAPIRWRSDRSLYATVEDVDSAEDRRPGRLPRTLDLPRTRGQQQVVLWRSSRSARTPARSARLRTWGSGWIEDHVLKVITYGAAPAVAGPRARSPDRRLRRSCLDGSQRPRPRPHLTHVRKIITTAGPSATSLRGRQGADVGQAVVGHPVGDPAADVQTGAYGGLGARHVRRSAAPMAWTTGGRRGRCGGTSRMGIARRRKRSKCGTVKAA